jgi:hypothetical protein
LQRLGPDLWWLPGRAVDAAGSGDADADNRGQIDNLLIARHGARLWLLGSGPSAAAGAALDCRLQQALGQRVTDVIAPWPHPELVLGQTGLPAARAWAHADVAAAMASRCTRCEARLRQRLGTAAVDLGELPVRLPEQRFSGDAGTLGPWRWWRLWRSGGTDPTPVTVWWHAASGVFSAPGLLWGAATPDLRDTDAAAMATALATLEALGHAVVSERLAPAGAAPVGAAPSTAASADAAPVHRAPQAAGSASPPPALRWLPGQGVLLPADAPARQRDYGLALGAAVRLAQDAGRDEAAPPLPLVGVAADAQTGARHTLNWQRRWREMEADWFDRAPPR